MKGNKLQNRILAFLLAAVMVGSQIVSAVPFNSRAGAPEPTVLLEEHFEGTQAPEITGGRVEGGVLIHDQKGSLDISVPAAENAETYVVEFKMQRINTDGKYVQIRFMETKDNSGEFALYDTSKGMRVRYAEGGKYKYRQLPGLESGNEWLTYKYEVNVAAKTVAVTVSDQTGEIASDLTPFYGEATQFKYLSFRIPSNQDGAKLAMDDLKISCLGSQPEEEPKDDGDVLLEETFDANVQPEGFKGAGQYTGGQLQYAEAGKKIDIAVPKAEKATAYVAEFDLLKADSTDHYIQLKLNNETGANFALTDTKNGKISLREVENQKPKYTEIPGASQISGEWLHYRYELDLTNRKLTLTVTDSNGQAFSGQAGFFEEVQNLGGITLTIPSSQKSADFRVDNLKISCTLPPFPEGSVGLYNEKFSKPGIPEGFSGPVKIQDGVLNYDLEGQKLIMAMPRVNNAKSYTVEFEMLKADAADNYIQLIMGNEGGENFALTDTRGGSVNMREVLEGKPAYTPLEGSSVPQNQWLKFRYDVDMKAKTVKLTVTDPDGAAVTHTAGFYADVLWVGQMIFYLPSTQKTGEFRFDNLKVYYFAQEGGEVVGDGNLLINGGFEKISSHPDTRFTGNAPQSWAFRTNWGSKEYIAQVDSSVSRTGTGSLMLGGGNTESRVSILQNVTGLDPNKYYKISGYIKAEKFVPSQPNHPDGPFLRADVKAAGGTRFFVANLPVKPLAENTYDWTYTEMVITPNATSLTLWCAISPGTGKVWFDDLRVEEYAPYISIAMNTGALSLKAGQTAQLSAVPYPSRENNLIEWSSSNPELATVDANGLVTATGFGSGEVIITASVHETFHTGSHGISTTAVKDYCTVTVTGEKEPEQIRDVKLSQGEVILAAGDNPVRLDLYMIPANPAPAEIQWISSDPSVAVVNNGYVVPLKAGHAVITAMVKGTKIADFCQATVTAPEEIPKLQPSEFTYDPNAEFDQIIKNSGYPKLLFRYDDLESIRQKALHSHTALTFTMMEAQADALLETTFTYHGTNAAGGRTLAAYLTSLTMTGYIKQDMRYINRAIEIMMGSNEKYTVVDYDHLNGDIALGDGAQAYAVGYDWLYPFMTQEQRDQIQTKLEEFGQYIYNMEKDRLDEHTNAATNHSSVTLGGLGLTALVLNNQTWIDASSRLMHNYYRISTDSTGFYGEGTDYFCYGALGAVTYSAALLKNGGEDILAAHPNYTKNITNMLLQYMLPNGKQLVPIGDSNGRVAPQGSWIYLISKNQDRTALWEYLKLSGDDGTRLYGKPPTDGSGASCAYILIWADPDLKPLAPENKTTVTEFEWGYNVYRDGWEKMDSLIGFISGYAPHRGHNQRDENSFFFYAKGENFAIDPGYNPSESLSHNTILIDGVGQAISGDKYDDYGKIIKSVKLAENVFYVEGEATSVYPARLGAKKVVRKMLVCLGDTPYIITLDEIQKNNDTKSNYSWLLQTDTSNHIILGHNSAQIIGSNTGATMHVIFPFEDNVILDNDPWKGVSVIRHNGPYIPSAYSKTLQAIISGKGDTSFISMAYAVGAEEAAPVVTQEGTTQNGTITVSYYNGTADRITFKNGSISYEKISIEVLPKPEKPAAPSEEELSKLPQKPITVQVNDKVVDLQIVLTEEGKPEVSAEEFLSVLGRYTVITEENKALILSSASDGKIGLAEACSVIGATQVYRADRRHAVIATLEAINQETAPDVLIPSVSQDKVENVEIDALAQQEEHPPVFAIDGDLSTHYSVEGRGREIILKLQEMYNIHAVGVAFNQGNVRQARFEIYVSQDGENWKKVKTCLSSGSTDGLEGYGFAPAEGQYVKLVCNGNTVNSWNSIKEIEIYGTSLKPTEPEETDPVIPETSDPVVPDIPTTGDGTGVALAVTLLMLTAAAVSACAFIRKKFRKV